MVNFLDLEAKTLNLLKILLPVYFVSAIKITDDTSLFNFVRKIYNYEYIPFI